MASTTVTVPDDVMERLRRMAEERGVGLEEVIQQVLTDWSEKAVRRPRSFGMGNSGFSDTSTLAGEMMPEPDPWHS